MNGLEKVHEKLNDYLFLPFNYGSVINDTHNRHQADLKIESDVQYKQRFRHPVVPIIHCVLPNGKYQLGSMSFCIL